MYLKHTIPKIIVESERVKKQADVLKLWRAHKHHILAIFERMRIRFLIRFKWTWDNFWIYLAILTTNHYTFRDYLSHVFSIVYDNFFLNCTYLCRYYLHSIYHQFTLHTLAPSFRLKKVFPRSMNPSKPQTGSRHFCLAISVYFQNNFFPTTRMNHRRSFKFSSKSCAFKFKSFTSILYDIIHTDGQNQ